MKGDFSKWRFNPKENFTGTLHQQGRVLLDTDGNAQTQINNHWQDQAARDAFGAWVAAVPSNLPDSFKVKSASVEGKFIKFEVNSGKLWADGILAYLTQNTGDLAKYVATYLEPPIQDPPEDTSSISNGVRDVVILELWREAFNSFQDPPNFIEPALGGPDTTERIRTAMRFRIYRLEENENCHNIKEKIQHDFTQKGKLKVTLQETTNTNKNCPVVEEGGYVGFEHQLYRIEIAKVRPTNSDNNPSAMFKWSLVNGGLVGRGKLNLDEKIVTLTANDQAIKMSGHTTFYMETIEENSEQGYWQVTYGAEVTLDGNDLKIGKEYYKENGLPKGKDVFFRLWNGILPITAFPKISSGKPSELRDGIRLEFDTNSNYTPGDYWTFEVRAGGIANNTTLINDKAPEGIVYHRVPLAVIEWEDFNGEQSAEAIEDCRKIFRPLTNQSVCCSFTVGDGTSSHGDFNSLKEALKHFPQSGGEICLLPGLHKANVDIVARQNIHIRGCGVHTLVQPNKDQINQAIFHIEASQNIHIDNMTLFSASGTVIELEDPSNTQLSSKDISITHNRIVACIHAINIKVFNETATENNIYIAHNQIAMQDKPEGKVGIFCLADGVLIEHNKLVVIPAPNSPNDPRNTEDPTVEIYNPCADPQLAYANSFPATHFLNQVFLFVAAASTVTTKAYLAQGGIQIGGGSEQVSIKSNKIIGGRGNGITLGHLPSFEIASNNVEPFMTNFARLGELQSKFNSFLYEIVITDNLIQNMGLSGIGVATFFNLTTLELLVSVNSLIIYQNFITSCVRQMPAEIPTEMLEQVGFGGIALADCENAQINENRIENNGLSHSEPICGIFMLQGENIEISRNHIINNGPRNTDDNRAARRGYRGGIVIKTSFKELVNNLFTEQKILMSDGIPAVKIHNNVVVQPLGQALHIIALGPVSVIGNQFTSQGVNVSSDPLSLLAGSVFVLNLGISKDFAFLLFPSFRNLARVNANAFHSNKELEALKKILHLPSGTVLFVSNQTTLDLRAEEVDFTLSSQLIASLDDVALTSNQSECISLRDIVLTNTALFAVSIRSNDNRFQEGITLSSYSLFSYGMMNTATANQATHCLQVLGVPYLRVESGNTVLFSKQGCDKDRSGLQAKYMVVAP